MGKVQGGWRYLYGGIPTVGRKKKVGWESCVYSHMASLLDCLPIVGRSCHPSSTFRVGVPSAVWITLWSVFC